MCNDYGIESIQMLDVSSGTVAAGNTRGCFGQTSRRAYECNPRQTLHLWTYIRLSKDVSMLF